MKKIVFVSGTRADFGKIKPLIDKVYKKNFEVAIFVTGMHTMARHGTTKIEVSNVANVNIYEFINHRHGDPQDVILAKTVLGFSDFVCEQQPDLIVMHGDRIEAMAASIVASTNYILSAHIEGGEVSGTIDEIFRHCNSKMNSHHFVSSETARNRLMKMGENGDYVHVIGSPELDAHQASSGVTIEQVRERYEIPFEEYGIVCFHPVTTELSSIGSQASSLFEALVKTDRNFVVMRPNNDPGCDEINLEIDSLPGDRFRVLTSMRFNFFSELMKNAACSIGNSSAVVREAPFLGLPSLDIGTRQKNRTTNKSKLNVSAYSQDLIMKFIQNSWGKSEVSSFEFGSGNAAERFSQILNNSDFWNISLQKHFQDFSEE